MRVSDTPPIRAVRVRSATPTPRSTGVEHAHRRAHARSRSLAYGRARAARRVDAGRFVPHPGWRHRVPDGRVVLTDQAAALTRVEDLVDAELWRDDRRTVALAVLRGLVHGMSWESGLVAGVTRAHLAAAVGCSPRTVSRVVAWAVEVELLVVVETGATAEFLGTEHNRAPSYVLTAPAVDAADVPLQRLVHPVGAAGVDTTGNPPACGAWETSPRRDRGLQDRQDENPWPLWDAPTTPAARARAVDRLLERTGLGARVVRWRAVAMLGPWFEAGWCVAGLLHALDHHPDRPDARRGDATRAARDPLRVLGHRLGPWQGRVDELPPTLAAVDGHARRARRDTHYADTPRADTATGDRPRERTWRPSASAATRAAARADVARVLDRSRHRTRDQGGSSWVVPVASRSARRFR